MTSSFAAYLASLDDMASPLLAPLTNYSLTSISATAPLESASSPQKRPRSDSPDSDAVRKQSTFSFFESSSTCLSPTSPTTSSTCVVRSILTHFTSSSPTTSSPPSSRPLSRRSSTDASFKSVRFARCTNASVFPALSGEEYDRSPIIPTCESESLELPKRKPGETSTWIKCVERARADAKKRAESGNTACAPFVPTNNFGPVEGVNGLIGGRMGGYFVGDEHEDESGLEGDEEEDGMVVDDDFEDEGDDDGAHHDEDEQAKEDDTSSGDDSDAVPSILSDAQSSSPSSPPSSVSHPEEKSSPPSLSLGFERTESVSIEDSMTDEEIKAKEEEEEKLKRRRACRAKYGLCSLGKFTRKEVFQSYDSLGGF